MVINGEVYQLDWMNSSGGWLTGFLNSFVNCIIFNAFFRYLCITHELGDLIRSEYLICEFYGDDNMWTVADMFEGLFTMPLLAEFIFENFGMVYTTPEKTAIAGDYMTFEEMTFLCRRFVKDGTRVFAPLDEASIHGMVLWLRKPVKGVSFSAQLAINVEQAAMEFFHHGQEKFIKNTLRLQEYCRIYNIPYTGKSYEYYYERWSQGCLLD
jgi:hypothetical protein